MKTAFSFCLGVLVFLNLPQAFAQEDSNEIKAQTPVLNPESSTLLADSSTLKSLDRTRYHISGVASIFPGFGIGHAVQGRWADRGWIITTGHFLTAAGFLFSTFLLGSAHGDQEAQIIGRVSNIAFIIASSLRVYEIADVWIAPGHKIENLSYKNSYYLSGITSIIPGFGIGHAIQGRWLDKGWIFTLGEILSLGGLIVAGNMASSPDSLTNSLGSTGLATVSFISYLIFKQLEINDVWEASSHYEVGQSPSLELKPIISLNARTGNNLGLSLKYSF